MSNLLWRGENHTEHIRYFTIDGIKLLIVKTHYCMCFNHPSWLSHYRSKLRFVRGKLDFDIHAFLYRENHSLQSYCRL